MGIDPPADLELELVESSVDGEPSGTPQSVPAPSSAPEDLRFAGELWYWRGPAPYHFITVPKAPAAAIHAVAADVTYGWGMIPVRVRIGDSVWETSLWPKDGGYVVPVKDRIRNGEGLVTGEVVEIELTVRR
jgi:hypothetical protein